MGTTEITPKDLRDVLAQIELGKSSWYEVVYHDGEKWCSYAGSDTFSTYGYNVVRWKYVDEIFPSAKKIYGKTLPKFKPHNITSWEQVPKAKYTRRLCL